MTWRLEVNGHTDEPYEQRKASEMELLRRIVSALLDKPNNNVSTFNFNGNEVIVSSFAEARKVIE